MFTVKPEPAARRRLSPGSFDRSFRPSRSLCDVPPASSSRVPSETHQRAGGGAEPAGQEVQDDPRRLRGQGVSARVRPPRRGAVSRQDDGRGSGYGPGRARRPYRSAPCERTQGRVIRESRRKVSFDCDEGHYEAIVMRDSPRPSSLVVRGSLIARRFVRLSDFIGEIFRSGPSRRRRARAPRAPRETSAKILCPTRSQTRRCRVCCPGANPPRRASPRRL